MCFLLTYTGKVMKTKLQSLSYYIGTPTVDLFFNILYYGIVFGIIFSIWHGVINSLSSES